MKYSLIGAREDFSYQLNCLHDSFWTLDSHVSEELENMVNDHACMRVLIGMAKESITTVFIGNLDLCQFTPGALGEEISEAIDELTNDHWERLIIMLILLENIASVSAIDIPENSEHVLLAALQDLLASNYEFLAWVDLEDFAA
jgi:hypothetical protein